MKVKLASLLLGVLFLAACTTETVEVTREVETEVEVTRVVEVEVTRQVEEEVEVTRIVEVTREVEVEVTREDDAPGAHRHAELWRDDRRRAPFRRDQLPGCSRYLRPHRHGAHL